MNLHKRKRETTATPRTDNNPRPSTHRIDARYTDLSVTLASVHVIDALKGKERIRVDSESRAIYSIYQTLRPVKVGAMTAYMMLSFFEIPTWRQHRDDTFDFYPTFETPGLPSPTINYVEICLAIILALFSFARKFVRIPSKTASFREGLHFVMTTIIVIVNILSISYGMSTEICQILRPFVFVLFVRSVRESWRRVVAVMYRAKETILLCAMHVVIFSLIGKMIFLGTREEKMYFTDIFEAVWNMFILLTTANFPDITIPAYKENRLYCIFFVVYLGIGVFFLMNMVLAVFYYEYRFEMAKTAENYNKKRSRQIMKGFEVLDTGSNNEVSLDVCCQLLAQLRKEKVYQLSPEDDALIVKLLDTNRSDTITKEEFKSICNVINYANIRKLQIEEERGADSRLHCVQFLISRDSKIFRFCRKYCQHPWLEALSNLITVASLFTLILVDINPKLEIQYWLITQLLFDFLYSMEILIKVIGLGVRRTFKSYQFLLDFVLLVTSFSLIIKLLTGSDLREGRENLTSQPLLIVKLIVIFRLYRTISLLGEFENFKIFFETAKDLMNPFSALIGVIVSIFYFFATIGVYFFGGEVSKGRADQFSSIPVDTIYNNFNDFPSALSTLFELLLISNWHYTAIMIESVTSKTSRLFFLAFYVFSVLVTVNLLVTFIIDVYFDRWSRDLVRDEHKEAEEEQGGAVSHEFEKDPNSPLVSENSRKRASNRDEDILPRPLNIERSILTHQKIEANSTSKS